MSTNDQKLTYSPPMKACLFLVYGRTGDYSDRREWVVAAYRDEAAAYEHVRLATEHYEALKAKYDDYDREDYKYGFPSDVPEEAWGVYDSDLNDSCFSTVEYYVGSCSMHVDPHRYREELAVAQDEALEAGVWVNGPYGVVYAPPEKRAVNQGLNSSALKSKKSP